MDEKTTQVYNFPSDSNSMLPWISSMLKNNGVDAATIAAMQNNGMFGGDNLLALIILFAIFGNGFGGFGFGGGRGLNMLNTDNGVQTIISALNGTNNDIANLSTALGVSTSQVQTGINSVMQSIASVGNQVGLGNAQVINAIQSGNNSISSQLLQCCCENRLAIAEQTNALQSIMANNHAAATLQAAQIEAADQLAVCNQTNALETQATANTTSILNAINAQTVAMNDQFCALKERELQNQINAQSDVITQLRGQISNDKQTETFNAAINALNTKITEIANKQPNTTPVIWPNLSAVNNTPVNYGGVYGNGYWS